MATLQNINNHLSFYLLTGVETHIQSSDIAAIDSNNKVNCNNSHDCIDNILSNISRLYYALLRYVNQYIFHTMVKLFCLIGWTVSIQDPVMGKDTVLGSVLVSNRPIHFENNTEE